MPGCFVLPAILGSLVAPLSTKDRAIKRFGGLVAQLAQTNGVLLVDGDNTRGKSGFSLSHEGLLGRTARWAQRLGLEGRCVVLVDHGSSADAFHMPQLGGASVAFSGPAASADDVAARDVGWFHRRGHDVMLVTADSGLIQRCRRSAAGRSLVVAPPQALLAAIGHDSSAPLPPSSPPLVPTAASVRTASPLPVALDERHLAALEAEMRARAAVTRADRQHKRIARNAKKSVALQRQRKSLRSELEAALARSSELGAPSLEQVTGVGAGALAPALQQCWLDALAARRAAAVRGVPYQPAAVEHTFDRVVLAERLRRRLHRRQAKRDGVARACGKGGEGLVDAASATASPSAVYAAMLNGEKQRDDEQAFAAPFSAARGGAVTVLSAAELRAATRAEATQLDALPGGRIAYDDADDAHDGAPDTGTLEPIALTPTSDERMALRALRVSVRDGTRPIEGARGQVGRGGARRGGSRRERQRKRRHAMVGLRRVASGGMREALASSANGAEVDALLSKEAPAASAPASSALSEAVDAARPPPVPGGRPLEAADAARLLVVSDTHGHEAALTHACAADVVVHCGDFAPGSPTGTRGRHAAGVGVGEGEGEGAAEGEDAAARLDAWLSQLDAPTKLVLRGNHDPPLAAFPRSGARYVTSVTALEAAGLTFALVPYSKGPLRGKLPAADVLVSHVPPKRILDKATSGEEAGDDSLRTAVRRAPRKPRLWLFGHIHEGAGAARARFGTRADAATVLVNAANANPGMARRLIQGPVVIDVEKP